MIVRLSWICTLLAAAGQFLAHGAVASDWRSTLYPEDWRPGFRDEAGRFLHDFSYAGYHRGEVPLPLREGPVIDVTAAPYLADAGGGRDSTQAIQSALDAAAAQGGGIVYLPAGTYHIAPPEGQTIALKVEGDNIVLRGAGTDKTFIVNTETRMRDKIAISVKARQAAWWYSDGEWVKASAASKDIAAGSLVIPVADASLFAVGDSVVLRNDPTERFIDSLGMSGKWTSKNLKGRALVFCRRITATDPGSGTMTIDVPTRYELKTADNARVAKLGGHMVSEVGLEDFSFGMRQHPGTEWKRETDYSVEGQPAYEVHQSHAIVFSSAENCWMRRVNSFSPAGNSPDVHVLSNGVKLDRSRLVTVEDCDWRHTQYKGGGGNGYLYTLHSNDCLIRRCHAEAGRHNFDFGTMAASGNVILDCVTKDAKFASDFHMHFSVANLIDNMTCDGDFIEARYRPYGGSAVHGVTTSQSVFWNTNGARYTASPFEFDGKQHNRPQILIHSEQFGEGYIIGTRGPASEVKTTNFKEGIGQGDGLQPRSLYLDQLARRKDAAGQ